MLSVLVVSPDPSVSGGVAVFIDCMKRHVTASALDFFAVGGQGKKQESGFAVMKRLIGAPLRLARLVRTRRFDVVHINPSFDKKSLIRDCLLLLALRMIGYRRILLYVHGWDMNAQRRIAGNAVLSRAVAWILNGAGKITVLGDAFRDGLVAIGVDPARLIVTRTMFEGAGLEAVRDEKAAPRRPFILFMSRFDREKGGRELLQAFAALAQDYPDHDLVMAGDGADARNLRLQADNLGISQRVIFTGYIGGVEKWRLLRDCALFALPTYYRSEGMPIAVLEAMGAGKPLLVGSVGALRSMARDPENGVVLDSITAQNVETGLRRLLDDKIFAAYAGKRNAEIAWATYEARIVTVEIESYYRQVAAC